MLFVMRVLCLAAFGLCLAGAGELPLGSGLNLFSVKEELELGRRSSQQFRASLTVVDTPELSAYLTRIAEAISKEIQRPEYDFSVSVFDDRLPFAKPKNATAWEGAANSWTEPVAFSDGAIFLPVSMLKKAKSEVDVIAAIAHSMAHIADRHVTRYLTRGKLIGPPSAATPEEQHRMVLASFRQQFEERANDWAQRWVAVVFPPSEQPVSGQLHQLKRAIDKL